MRRLHILVISRAVAPLHGFGGLEQHVHDLVRHLAAREICVTLITKPPVHVAPTGEQSFGPLVRVHHVPYRQLPFQGVRGATVIDRSTAYPMFGVRAGSLAAELVKRGDVHIVHGMGAACLGYARERERDRYSTVPLILNPHGMEEFGSTGPHLSPLKHIAYAPLRRAVRTCAAAADRVIATDNALAPIVRKHLGVSASRLVVIPNAVDLNQVDRTGVSAPSSDVLLLGVGRLEHNKGFHHLLAALATLAKEPSQPLGPRWRCVILGEGSARGFLERRIAEADLGRHVSLPGRVSGDDLHTWYEAATLFVHPTLYEGSSIVTLEAMAHRRAVVASAAGGIPDKVRPGINGWLVAPADEQALARAIEQALADRQTLIQMGGQGRAIVEREFSWSAVANRLVALYDEVLTTSLAAR